MCPFLARRGCTFRELANYEYDYLGRALDGKPDLSQRCHLTSSLSSIVSTFLGPLVLLSRSDLARDVASRNRISRIIAPRQVSLLFFRSACQSSFTNYWGNKELGRRNFISGKWRQIVPSDVISLNFVKIWEILRFQPNTIFLKIVSNI